MEKIHLIVYELIPGFRKNSLLLYTPVEEQIYKFKYSQNNTKYYNCYQKGCHVNIAVDLNNALYCRKIKLNLIHNHESQKQLREKLNLINSIKSKCANVSLKRTNVREVFNEECKKAKESAHTVEFGTMRRQLINIKSEIFPKAPCTFQDIVSIFNNSNIRENFTMSRYDKDCEFYRGTIIENDICYSIFVSPSICKTLIEMPITEPRHYLIDATFNVVPFSNSNCFKQLLIIHIAHSNHSFPFIYILMSSKSMKAYSHVLQYIQSNILDLKPTSITTDFEYGIRKALANIYPEAQLKTCWFHYTQAVRRNASKLHNFIPSINKNNEAKKLFRKFLILPLLKPCDLSLGYENLKNEAMSANFKKLFEPFIKYFERQWIKKEGASKISVYKEAIKTTSSIESFNGQLSNNLTKKGNFFRFLDFLLNTDVTKSIDFKKSIDGCVSMYKKRSKKQIQRENYINNVIRNLDCGRITLNDCINQLCYNVLSLNTIPLLDCEHETNVSLDDNNEDISEPINSTIDNNLICVICYEKPRDVLLMPCNHFKMCQNCYDQMNMQNQRNSVPTLCPVCRTIVKEGKKIFA